MNGSETTRLPRLGPGEGVRFRASDRDLSCPVCGGDRFWTVRDSPLTMAFSLVPPTVLQPDMVRLTCETCAHILWFQADAPLEALD